MNDTGLDDLLTRSISPLTPSVTHEAALLAQDASLAPRPRRNRPRKRWVIPAVVVGVLAFTGAGTLAAGQLALWPFVAMPEGNVRTTVRVPVNWTTDDGHHEQCGAWLELRNAGPGDREALDAAIRARDWDGFGQRLYDSGTSSVGDPDGEQRVGDMLDPVLIELVRGALPGVLIMGERGERVGLDAFGLSCVPERP